MQGSVIYGPGDVRFEQRDDPTITESTDAIIKISATCVCGSDLWDYRGINQITEPTPMGHEYCGIVQAVGSDVRRVRPGQFVIGSFFAAEVRPSNTVAVVGDGAVGLLGVLAARQLGADTIIAMSRHQDRQKLALDFGATEIVTARGDVGVAHIKELTE